MPKRHGTSSRKPRFIKRLTFEEVSKITHEALEMCTWFVAWITTDKEDDILPALKDCGRFQFLANVPPCVHPLALPTNSNPFVTHLAIRSKNAPASIAYSQDKYGGGCYDINPSQCRYKATRHGAAKGRDRWQRSMYYHVLYETPMEALV